MLLSLVSPRPPIFATPERPRTPPLYYRNTLPNSFFLTNSRQTPWSLRLPISQQNHATCVPPPPLHISYYNRSILPYTAHQANSVPPVKIGSKSRATSYGNNTDSDVGRATGMMFTIHQACVLLSWPWPCMDQASAMAPLSSSALMSLTHTEEPTPPDRRGTRCFPWRCSTASARPCHMF